MRLAIEEAKMTKGPKRFGAVIVRDGQLVAKAYTTVYEENDPTKHAEILAISRAALAINNKKLENCILYSTLPEKVMFGSPILRRI